MIKNRHGGNIRQLSEEAGLPPGKIRDFSANINPLGPPGWLKSVIDARIADVIHYPDPDCLTLVKSIASCYGLPADQILAGNGSAELFHLLPAAMKVSRAVIPVPAYGDYAVSAELAGADVMKIPLNEEDNFRLDLKMLGSTVQKGDIVYIGRPNNPAGISCEGDALRDLAIHCPGVLFVVDEAFADFVEGLDRMIKRRPPNVVVLCSFTKIFAIPGIRLGCMIADDAVIKRVKRCMPPWSVNVFAQAVGEEALRDFAYVEETRRYINLQRDVLLKGFRDVDGLTVFPGEANFLLLRIDKKGINASMLAGELLREGIAIRVCDNFDGLGERYFRVAVKTEKENEELLQSVSGIFNRKVADPMPST